MLSHCPQFLRLQVLIMLKLVATIMSFSVGFNGGVFAPCLFLGALCGSLVAHVAQDLGFTQAPFALFAFMGMGATIASVFGAPLFAVIVVLEMTASFPATTLVLVSVTTSFLITHECFGVSLFHYQLKWLSNMEASHRGGDLYDSEPSVPTSMGGGKELEGLGSDSRGDGMVETTFGRESLDDSEMR